MNKKFEELKKKIKEYNLTGRVGLIVDDEKGIRSSLKSLLEFEWGMEALTASSGREALKIINSHQRSPTENDVALIIADYQMPGTDMNGIEFLREVKRRTDLSFATRCILTGYADLKSVMEALNEGLADKYLEKPLRDKGGIKKELEVKIVERDVLKNLPRIFWEVTGWKSENLNNHSKNVAILSENMALEMGFSTIEVAVAYYGGTLHDIGKIKIPDHILDKPAKLTKKEMEIVKSHVWTAADYLSQFDYLSPYVLAVLAHHENWNGTGYLGLKEEEIPKMARILRIADSWDAIIQRRNYDPARKAKDAFNDIKSNAGIFYDPDLIKIFERTLKKMKLI